MLRGAKIKIILAASIHWQGLTPIAPCLCVVAETTRVHDSLTTKRQYHLM